MAQVALKERHGIESTENISLDCIPQPLQSEWVSQAEGGIIKVGLQSAYRLPAALKRPPGREVPQIHSERHKAFDKLWTEALELACLTEKQIPEFPSLGDSAAAS